MHPSGTCTSVGVPGVGTVALCRWFGAPTTRFRSPSSAYRDSAWTFADIIISMGWRGIALMLYGRIAFWLYYVLLVLGPKDIILNQTLACLFFCFISLGLHLMCCMARCFRILLTGLLNSSLLSVELGLSSCCFPNSHEHYGLNFNRILVTRPGDPACLQMIGYPGPIIRNSHNFDYPRMLALP